MNTPNHLTENELHALVDEGLWPMRFKTDPLELALAGSIKRMLLLDECVHGHSNCGLDGKCGDESQ